MIKEAEIGKTVSRSLVLKWHKRFKDGRETSNDDRRTGCPKLVAAKGNVSLVKEKVNADRRITLRQLSEELKVECYTREI